MRWIWDEWRSDRHHRGCPTVDSNGSRLYDNRSMPAPYCDGTKHVSGLQLVDAGVLPLFRCGTRADTCLSRIFSALPKRLNDLRRTSGELAKEVNHLS